MVFVTEIDIRGFSVLPDRRGFVVVFVGGFVVFSVLKDVAADLDYAIDWSQWLGNDTIASSVWTAAPGLTMHSGVVINNKIALVWLSGGTVSDTVVRVTNKITTVAGRVDERSLAVQVVQK